MPLSMPLPQLLTNRVKIKKKINEIFAKELEISASGQTLLILNIECFCSTSLEARPWMKQTSDHSILISQHEHAR